MTPFSKIPPPRSAPLFGEEERQHGAPLEGVHVANIDGASRGNPGAAAYAVVLRDPSGKIALELAKKIGRETNNVAEYYALLAALDYATSHGIKALRIRSDSQLLVQQIKGIYKVNNPALKQLHERATRLIRQLPYFAIEHVRRELNRDADALANVALDSGNVGPASASSTRHFENRSATPPRVDASRAVVSKRAAARSDSHLSFRARVVKGTIVPVEPLDLPEGSLVAVNLEICEEP